jgi:selenocysteine-specific elongation factor
VIGTAGHIDHGKSTLVKRLTDIDPDRWEEEKTRGMTIDMGFANFLYQDKYRIGMIDVPGHEKFVKNMVAGASGVDIVMLVVAADDGVMPQTREHLEILSLLGVSHGLVVLNKIDAVDEDTVELAKEDVSDLVGDTFLADAPVIPVSALTGDGIDKLWEELGKLIEATPARDTSGLFRMPVQRVFTAKGRGAVLTGIPLSGQASIGDNLMVVPGEQKAKVRGLQAYHETIETARAGHSAAFNLAAVDHSTVHRGYTLCSPDVFEESRHYSIDLSMLGNALHGLKHRQEIKFHVGTSELVGHLHLLDRFRIEAGEQAICEVLLEEPVVAGIGDHFILRLPSPAITLGGGRIIKREPEILPRNDAAVMESLAGWRDAADSPQGRVAMGVTESGPMGMDLRRLVKLTELSSKALPPLVAKLLASGEVTEFGPQRLLVHKDAWTRAEQQVVGILKKFHEEHSAQMGLKQASVQAQLGVDGRTFNAIMNPLFEKSSVEQRGDLLGLPGEGGKLTDEERSVVTQVQHQLETFELNPPTLKELAKATALNTQATQNAVDYLVGSGQANVLGGVLFSTPALESAKAAAIKLLNEKGEAGAKDFKEVIPTSRKFLIPILEWLDQQNVTRFVNGIRTLK